MIGCAVRLEGDERSQFLSHQELVKYLAKLDPATTTVVAFNAMFDACILAWRYNFLPARMVCTMRTAVAVMGYKLRRHSLAAVAECLGAGVKGDAIQQARGKHRADMVGDPVYWRAYQAYACNDNDLNRNIFLKLMGQLPRSEWRIMDHVLRCAVDPRFVINTKMLKAHLDELKELRAQMLIDAGATTTMASPDREQKLEEFAGELRSSKRFETLLQGNGIQIEYKPSATDPTRNIPAFSKTDAFMTSLLEHEDPAIQALACARLGLRSTIEQTRGERMLGIGQLSWPGYCHGNMPIPLKYAGAHTHRFSGDWQLNMQNLPSGRGGKVSKLRKALCAPPGYKVVVADKAQIECRIAASICDQQSLLAQFRDKKDPYAVLAASVFGRPIDKKVDIVERFIGKTGVLGLGYGCGHDRFFHMVYSSARMLGLDMDKINHLWTPQLARQTVNIYRTLNNQIQSAWAVLDSIISSTWVRGTPEASKFGPVLITKGCVELPGGLHMRYDNPRWDTERSQYMYDYGGRPHYMYGAKFLENITQALARVNIMHDALRISDQGYPFALQAHDELVWVVPDEDVEDCKEIALTELRRSPSWASELPLDAEAGVGQSYGDAR